MVAGIHSDAAITGQKGPPMMSDDESLLLLQRDVLTASTMLAYLSCQVTVRLELRIQLRSPRNCCARGYKVGRRDAGIKEDVLFLVFECTTPCDLDLGL